MFLNLLTTLLLSAHAQPAMTSVDFIKKNAVPLQALEVPPTLISSLENKKLYLIGEGHGTKEYPEYAGAIAEAASKKYSVAMGLEFPSDIQSTIDQYLVSGDEKLLRGTEFFKNSSYHSGRGSQAMVALLRKLRSLKIPVLCFDIAQSWSGRDRDTAMAKNIFNFITSHPGTLLITYSGNVHSRLNNGFPG